MYTSLLHNYVPAHLLAFLHFGFICVFPCLPYFLQCVFALLYCFLAPNYSLLHIVDVLQILVGLSASSSVLFFCRCAFFFVVLEVFGYLSFVFRFLFVNVYKSDPCASYFGSELNLEMD